MAARELVFDIFAIDRASAVFERVGLAAEASGTKFGAMGAAMGKGLAVASVAIGAIAAESAKMAADFETSIVKLETTAGESKANLGMVSDGLLNMAGKVGFTADELAKGMYIVESAGYHGADGLKVMEAAAKGARIEGASLGDVANAVSSLLVDYHMSADQAARVTNVMTAAVGHGKTTFQEMATALPNVAAAAASAKISMEEVTAALATMTMHGTDAAKAGTYLRQVIGQMMGPGEKARGAMKGLGIDANQLGLTLSSGSGHGLVDAIKMLEDGINKHLGPAGLVAVETFKKTLGSTQDYNDMLGKLPPNMRTTFGALMDMTGGVKSLQGFLQLGGENLKIFADNTAAVRKQVKDGGDDVAGFAEQQATLNGKIKDVEGSMSALAIQVGNALLPPLKDLFDHISTGVAFVKVLAEQFSGGAKSSQGLSDNLAILAMTIGNNLRDAADKAAKFWNETLHPAIDKVWELLKKVAGWVNDHLLPILQSIWDDITGHAGAWGTLAAGVAGVVLAIEGLTAATKLAKDAQLLYDAAMAANPVGIVIVAIAALIAMMVYLYNTNAEVRDSMNYGFATMKDSVFSFAAGAVQAFQWFFNASTIVFDGILQAAAAALGWLPGGVGDAVTSAAAKFHSFRDDTNKTLDGIQKDLHLKADTAMAEYAINALNRDFHALNWVASITIDRKMAGMDASLGVPTHATGTEHWRGGMTWVGENGPELVNLPAGSKVKDTNASKAMGGSNGGPMVHIENYNEAHQHPDDIAAAWMFKVRSA